MPRAHSAAPDTPLPPKPEPAKVPTPDTNEAKQLMQKLGLESESSISPMVILAAVVALFVVIGGSIFLINDGPTPSQLAAAENASTTEYVPPELGAWYCRNPAPRPEAPEPTADVNGFVVFEHANGERTASPLDVFAHGNDADPAYALCLSGIENGEDVECVGYSDGTSLRFESMDWSATLIQLSTGEAVFNSDVLRGADPDCPAIRTERLGVIRADLENLRYATVPWAFPSAFTERHLGNELNVNDGSWCDGSTPLANLGSARYVAPQPVESDADDAVEEVIEPTPEELALLESPPAVYVSGWPNVRSTVSGLMTVDSTNIDMISHVACVAAVWPQGRNAPRCDFNDFVLAWRPYTYRVTVVDVATGEALASQNFDGVTTCPTGLFTDTKNEIRDAVIPAEVGTFIESTVGIEAP